MTTPRHLKFGGRCLKCNKIMLYEPEDRVPMCDECKHKATKEFQQKIRPDSEPVVLHSEYIDGENKEEADA